MCAAARGKKWKNDSVAKVNSWIVIVWSKYRMIEFLYLYIWVCTIGDHYPSSSGKKFAGFDGML